MAHEHKRDIYYYQKEKYQRSREFDISPPNSVSEAPSLSFESNSISLHISGLVNQQLQTITSFKDLVNVVNHNTTNLIDFSSHAVYSICIRVI